MSAADLARAAAALAAAGKNDEAAAAYARALTLHPGDARLHNSAGNFHARARRDEAALALFERAAALDPTLGEAAVNAAIVALRLGRPAAADAALLRAGSVLARDARAWTLRAEAARVRGDHAAAHDLLAKALLCNPAHPAALRAEARLLLERGDPLGVERHEAALAREPGNFELMRGYAEALQAAGRGAEALDFAAALAAHFPSWIEGQVLLAELRFAGGDADYAGGFAAARKAHPDPALDLAWANVLSGADRHREAAEVLRAGLAQWPDATALRLALGVALGEAGDAFAAAAVLAEGPDDAAWTVARARTALRLGRVAEAAGWLEPVARADLDDVAAWSLLDCAWRLLDDPRHDWLHGDPALISAQPLPLDAGELAELRMVLRGLHKGSSVPLAQSVKAGTQTRGSLFARSEPILARLRAALHEALDQYRAALPAADPAHPLLSRRDAEWRIVGSWSVRFEGQGRHAAHIHPRGLLSSACYLVVPEEVDAPGGPGWLELGRPPEGIAAGLGPLRTVKPEPGQAVLFPSTLFHGTRPIAAGERMTVAFDVAADAG